MLHYICSQKGKYVINIHQYSHNFFVGTCAGLYKPVQALKVESLQAKQAMSNFSQVWFYFAQQAMTSPQDDE
jgi:hypothetical protein